MKNGKYCLAIVGFGGMGSWHDRLVQGKPRVATGEPQEPISEMSIAGIYDIDPARCKFAEEQGIFVYDSLDAILADESVDIVLCATPNEVHKEVIIRTLRAGKTAVSEKPVTLCSSDLQEMIDVANETGNLFTVHQNRRWDGDYLTIKQLYNTDILGDIFEIQSRVHGARGIPGDWRGKKEHGGGMVLDWGVHIIDQVLMMVDSKVKSIYATMDHVTTDEVDDGFRIILKFENGLQVVLEVCTSNFVGMPRWYVLGINGSAVIQKFGSDCDITRITNRDINDAVPIETAAGLTKTMAPRTADTTISEVMPNIKSDIRDFYRNVIATMEGKETQLITHTELMRVMKLMEAAFESARLGQVIPFE